jgi:hypothetical protein
MSGTAGVGSGISNYLPLLESSNPTSATGSGSGSGSGSSTTPIANSSASLTPTAQLLSSLIALQSEDPTQFTQIVSQIANQLQTAGQVQGQSGNGQFLQQLASSFKNVADSGDIMQLLPQSAQSSQAYNSNGQSLPTSSPSDPTSLIIQQLLAGIAPQSSQSF